MVWRCSPDRAAWRRLRPGAGFWIGLSPPQYLPQAALTLLVADQVDETTDPAEITAYGWVADEGADIDG